VVFHPFISAALEFESALDWTTTVRFADQPGGGRALRGENCGPETLGRLAVAADVDSTHCSFSLMYGPDVGDRYTSQAGSARVSHRF
jgi:hypothetical protein